MFDKLQKFINSKQAEELFPPNFERIMFNYTHTNNLGQRALDHRKSYENFIVIHAFKVINKVEIETAIKTHPRISKQLRQININGNNKNTYYGYQNIDYLIDTLKDLEKTKASALPKDFKFFLEQNITVDTIEYPLWSHTYQRYFKQSFWETNEFIPDNIKTYIS